MNQDEESFMCYVVSFLFLLSIFFSLLLDGLTLLSVKSAIEQLSNKNNTMDYVFSEWNKNNFTLYHLSNVLCMNISGFLDPRVVDITIS